MPQIFRARSNTTFRVLLVLLLALLAGAGWLAYAIVWSPYVTRVGVPMPQPVAFSHEHHAGVLGIDCRYCHESVERAAFAGMPSTHTCMTCHSQLFIDQEMLQPIRSSLAENRPVRWTRVHDLPDFTYFHHGIHVQKGIGCSTCHGRVDKMPLTFQTETLYMKWCLDCHRDPARFIRPANEIFNMAWTPDEKWIKSLREKVESNPVGPAPLTECQVCHR